MSIIEKNILHIRERINDAAYRSDRNPDDIKLMAVTKTVECGRIIEAVESGIDIIGENYIQEARRKIEKLGKEVKWHMIGHLQSNKAKYAVRLFDMVHSVDRIELAQEIDRRAKSAGTVMKILIEVNLSGEVAKSGIVKENLFQFVQTIASFKNLSLLGLMTMPPWSDDPENSRPFFSELRRLRDAVACRCIEGVSMNELSMGMSDDYQIAVEEGSTIVRIGRAIFGERS
ncbi:MAG: YggS family pyridoxal phosphate-dependent enzyme [Syntrophales bacterium]|jgi:pyridoxal phosphate enzyme (YggS family)|nr:YggS family pyridoxal phosphate-dependent enzyme [Syntrophales bacterium]MDY0045158.1 YggS family pyridoxal phosphate-dependent enzyme [Syntrophales bacterium]